jgi:hypothetical protein
MSKLNIVLLAGACALIGCKKKSGTDNAPAAEKPAAGSAAAPAAAPAAPAGAIAVKHGQFPEYSGNYDGSKAIALLSDSSGYIMIPMGCPAFDCGIADDFGNNYVPDKRKAACPTGKYLTIEITDQKANGDPKPGKHDVRLSTEDNDGGSGLADSTTIQITNHTADVVEGTVAFKDGDSTATGSFKATVCKAKP